MSIHKSLFIGGALAKQRSVWTRRERLAVLQREGRWEEGDSVFGLPKVRTKFKIVSKKKKKAQAAEAAQAEASPEAAGEEASSAEG